jgi:hypothetical protein
MSRIRGAWARLGNAKRASIQGRAEPSLITLGNAWMTLHFLTHRASELFLHSLLGFIFVSPSLLFHFAYSRRLLLRHTPSENLPALRLPPQTLSLNTN